MAVFLLVVGLVLFVCLVIVHEFGHFIAARHNGVDVEEFGLGFPPQAVSKKMKSGYVLSLNWLPLGGFVRLKGEHDSDKGKGSFGEASLWSKTKIMSAGVIMNIITAFVMLTILAVIGMPQLINNQFTVAKDTKVIRQEVLAGYVEPNSPASSIGLKSQDDLLSIGLAGHNPEIIHTSAGLPSITQQFASKNAVLTYSENGQTISKNVTLRSKKVVDAAIKAGNPIGYLGISPTDYSLQRSTWSAPIVALGLIKQITILTFKGIGTAIAGLVEGNGTKAASQVSGPVGIVVLLKNGSLLGYQFVLMIVAIISLSLAIINILPIPALDGGRLFFTIVPRLIFKRPLKQKTEDLVHGVGMAVLLLLFVLITIVDIKRFL